MADVFVSYSRRDSAYVQRLVEALESRGKDVWVDVEGIRDAEVFPEALRRAVESTDSFVFVISPDSVRSPFCEQEIERAVELNKRVVPLALRPVLDEEIPEEVRFRNWIPAGEDEDFEGSVERLVRALDTDLEWERQHTRLTVKALEWDQASRDRSFLVRGADLAAAEQWLAAGADKDPGPTVLEREYLLAARAAAARRQRTLVGVSLGIAAVSIALLVFALLSRGQAIHSRNAANAQALESDAQRVGTQALEETNLDRSLLLAVLGVKLQDSPETRGHLLAALQKSPAAIRLIRPSRNEITALAIDPRSRLLATGDSAGSVRVEDMRTWRPSGLTVQLKDPVLPRAMRFSPDGRTLAVAAGQGVQTALYGIDVASRHVRRIGSWPGLVPPKPAGSTAIAYSPDGRRLAVGLATASPTGFTPAAERLLLLDASSGRVVWQRRYPMRPGQWEAQLEFAPDGTLLTSAQQGATILWNARTGRISRRFPIGGTPAISADGRHVALGRNSPNPAIPSSSVSVLDLRTGRHRSLSAALPSSWITSLAFTPDGASIVGGSFEGDVRVWNVATGAFAETYVAQLGARAQAVLDPRGRTVVSGSEDGSVVAWDVFGSRRLGRAFRWNTPDASCPLAPCAVVDPRSTVMATDQGDGTIALVDLHSLRLTDTLPARNGPTSNALAFFPDGRTLVTGGINGRVTFWDMRTRSVARTLDFKAPVWWAAVSRDGRLLAVQTQGQDSPGSRVKVLRVATGRPLWTHDVPNGNGGLYFSADSRTVAALGCCNPGSTVVAWDARTGAQRFRRNVANHATAIGFSPDSRLLGVGAEDGKVLLWGARDGKQRGQPIPVASGGIDQISFSPDGSRFAASSLDQTTTLWDLRSRKRLGNSFPIQLGAVPVPVFERNGRLLIEYLSNAAEWPTDLRTWERFACQVAGRDLTRGEWSDILPKRAYRHICPE